MRKQPGNLSSIGRSALALCALLGTTAPASGIIIGSYTENGDGTVTYSYKIDNSSGDFDIFAWSLDFDFAFPDWNQIDSNGLGDVSVPNSNWIAGAGVPSSGLSAQDFLSLDPGSDILIGDILDGFSFTSRFLPGVISYHEFSTSGDSITSTTIGPINRVPEAGRGLEAVAIAGLGLFAAVTRGRRSAA